MARQTWVVPAYSKGQVDRAGDVLRTAPHTLAKYEAAMEVVNNWRSCHAYPLNTFQMNLRRAVKRVMQAPGLVSQRPGPGAPAGESSPALGGTRARPARPGAPSARSTPGGTPRAR